MAKRKYKSRVKPTNKIIYNTGGYTLAPGTNLSVLDNTDPSNMSLASERYNESRSNNGTSAANAIGGALSGMTSTFNTNSDPSFNKAAQSENAVMSGVSAIPVVGGIIGGVDAFGEAIGGPIRKNLEKTDHAGNINNPGKVKSGAIIGGLFDPIKALTTRMSYKGGMGDITGDGYVNHLESIGQEEFRNTQNNNSNNYLSSIGESTRVMANGGDANNEQSELTKFFGPSHDRGGIDIGGGKEVEGGETMKDGFVHSDRIGYDKKGNPTFDEKATKTTFADKAKKIDKLFIGRNDAISKKTKEMMYAKVENDNRKVGPIADAMNGNPSEEGKFYYGSDGQWYPDQQPLNLQTGNPMPTERIPEQKQYMPTATDNRHLSYLPRNQEPLETIDKKTFDGDIRSTTPQSRELATINNNPTASNNNSTTDSKIGFTPGDYVGMSSNFPSIGRNMYLGMEKPEVESLQLNPEADKIKQMMADRKINFQELNNELIRERGRGVGDIGDNTRGVGSRNANLQALYSNIANKKAGLKLQEQQVNNTYRGEEANTLNSLGAKEAAERVRKQTVDSQNKAFKTNAMTDAFSGMSKQLATNSNIMNANSTNNVTLASVNALSQKYGVDPRVINRLITQGYSGEALDNELIKYRG